MRTVTTVRVWMNVAGAMALAAIGVVAQTPPAGGGAPPQAAANPCGPTTAARGGGMLAGAGPSDKPPVDPAAADRAKPCTPPSASPATGRWRGARRRDRT